MNNKEFIASLASKSKMSVNDTQKLMRTFIDVMTAHFQDSDFLTVPSFGSFEVKKRLERIMVNPSTGQRMLVPPKLVLGFKPSSSVREKVRKGGQNDE